MKTPGTLVHNAAALAATLKRMHIVNECVIFWNEQRSFKLMLRNDPVDADTLACELALVFEEGDDRMAELIDMTNDGYVDEPGTFVLESWSFPAAEFGIDEAAKIMHAVNTAYLCRVCPCTKYLIKDDAVMCFFCQMTSTPDDTQTHFCSICCEDGLAMHMARQPCCGQHLHAQCAGTWKATSGNERCPLCRQ